jgi:cell division transport system permease protein
MVDYRAILDRLSAITTAVSLGLFGLSVIMLISAVVLVSNTCGWGCSPGARRSASCGLVGATNWRIRVPFLIEGGSEALLGASARRRHRVPGKVFVG